jgi:LmbE family N-acetylglucosaminyl deacetylase
MRSRLVDAASLLAVLAVLALCACGDNGVPDGEPLVKSSDLVVVAHPDDDLFFMQPDLLDAVRRNTGITSVYVTAGNGLGDVDAAAPRYGGLRYAYGSAAGSTDWHCGWILIAGHSAEHCRLADKRVSLVFLGYPDGGKQGDYSDSLLELWEGRIASAQTIASVRTSYTRDELIGTLAQIVTATQPATVHTLEVAATHGSDHSDHMIAGALTILAIARENSQPDVISYRGYSILDEPANKPPAILDATFDMVSHYEACNTDCGTCGSACNAIDAAHLAWLSRRYAVGFRRAVAGRMQSGTRCLATNLSLVPCEAAPVWRSDVRGELRSADDHCLTVTPTGDVSLADCAQAPERRFLIDDEGHVWSGLPPLPQADMAYAHLSCLAPTVAGGIRAQLCGRDTAPTWEFAPSTKSTLRAAIGFAASGRDVRLGDVSGDGKADLCTVENAALMCTIGDGGGGFITPAVQIADALAVEPSSLTFGDVDGDHRQDACGRDRDGILCATAAQAFAVTRWSPAFNNAVERSATSASLAAVDANGDGIAEICGIDASGVSCASRAPMQPMVRSRWPDPNAPVWMADLDGDVQADWCTATSATIACGVEAERPLTSDGISWAFVLGGVVDMGPTDIASIGLADIDGDGRADLCSQRDDRILCARSQGRGFGPRTTLAILPEHALATALWLGDLDGDGDADACADTAVAIVCAVEPMQTQ